MIEAPAADAIVPQEGSISSKQDSNGGAKEILTATGEESPLTASYRQGELIMLMVRIVLGVDLFWPINTARS